jgi:hypothetical protein
VKPSLQGSAGLVEDCSSSRVDVMTAVVAGIGRATRYPVVLGNALARFAVDSFRVEKIPKPFKACCVIWEHSLEVFECKPLHLWFVGFHEYRLAEYVPTVKG